MGKLSQLKKKKRLQEASGKEAQDYDEAKLQEEMLKSVQIDEKPIEEIREEE